MTLINVVAFVDSQILCRIKSTVGALCQFPAHWGHTIDTRTNIHTCKYDILAYYCRIYLAVNNILMAGVIS